MMIHTLANIYSPDTDCGLPDGRYVKAVFLPCDMNRIKAAWAVLTGKAYAIKWPEPGELEAVIGIGRKSAGQLYAERLPKTGHQYTPFTPNPEQP